MARRPTPKPLRGDQLAASDPQVHAALSASAGTGKTQVLTARVLRLLLHDVAPQSILCLTFTKAGAAEMANRLGDTLARWVRMSDGELDAALNELGEDVGPDSRTRARRLFARVIEAPGGLRVQTIHGFAQTLLASFPVEARIAPGLEPIEGRAERELARRTLANLAAEAEASGNTALLDDLKALSLRLGEAGATDYLMAAARADQALRELGDPAVFEDALRTVMGVPQGAIDDLIAARCADDSFDCGLLHRLADANRQWATATGTRVAANIATWLAADPATRAASLREMVAGVLKLDLTPAKVSAKLEAIDPDYASNAEELAVIVAELAQLQVAAALAAIQAAGLRAGAAFAAAYAAAKRAAGVADFDDLIRWTRDLFANPGMGEWIRFKLDQRVDHVLVDEAQDTNADQWAIVEALVGEYFSGDAEARGRHRTLFMVGDYKQAIYSFQGTDPRQFEQYRRAKAEQALALDLDAATSDANIAARPFRDLSIRASFRSSPAVLELVDSVIAEVGHRNMGLADAPGLHPGFHARRPGSVELWPPFSPESGREEDDAGDEAGEEGWIGEPARLYAERIARQVRDWLDEAPLMASTGRPLAPGDIMILVRSRTELAALIVARLFAEGVPVAGIDRLHLSKPLAVKDLLAAIGFAVQPRDDLNLASLLVSPLLGWDQDQLFDLAHGRGKGVGLWQRVQARRDEGGAIGEAFATLSSLLAMADFVVPATFLETILSGPMRGRAKLLARLGEAARDPIEELVNLALAFERRETASLDRFLAWFAAGEVEIKRDAAAPGNAVRVMTVHGAKGLEAPLVILADATQDPARIGANRPVMAMKLGGDYPVPLVRPRKPERVAPFGDLIDEQKRVDLEEHWRLLYVALTRAAERLVVTGLKPRGSLSDNSWHSLVGRGLQRLGAVASADGALCWRGSQVAAAARPKKARLALPEPARPAWLDQPAPAEETPPRPLSPSALIADREARAPPSPEMRAAARRGTLLHALFERLPGVVPAQRHGLALSWLERMGVADAADREEIADAACALLGDVRFADVFGADSLAEAPIAATLADGRVIAGTVDRLCIGEGKVRVIDFKTGRSVPADAAAVPESHRQQMRAYADALKVIFPDREIEAALLYTHGPRLIVVDG